MKDPAWSARIKNDKMILSSGRTAQIQNHQTNAMLTAIKVENNVNLDWPMKDDSETDLSPVYEEKYEITPSPSKSTCKHHFETKPSVKAEAVPYKERSQCLKSKETDAATGEESGWYESYDEHSYEIKRDGDDTDCLLDATDRQNHDLFDKDTRKEKFDEDFPPEVSLTERWH